MKFDSVFKMKMVLSGVAILILEIKNLKLVIVLYMYTYVYIHICTYEHKCSATHYRQ